MKNLKLAVLAMGAWAFCLGCGLVLSGRGDAELPGGMPLDKIMRVDPPGELKPVSPEAAAVLHQRGDVLLIDGAYIFHGASSGLVVYERKESNVFFKGALPLPGAVTDLSGAGDLLAVSCGAHGLFMVDVHDRSMPEVLTRLRFAGAVHRLNWVGQKMTVALGTMGVALLDMTRPKSPRLLGYWPSEGMVRHAVRVGKTIYVAEGRRGVAVLAYKPGRGLSLTGRLETEGNARALWAHEELLFVAEGTVGVSILRAGEGGQLERGETLAMGDTARDVFFDGQRLLTALGDRGVAVLDVSDPAAPRVSARFENKRPVNRVRAEGDLLFLGNDSSGLVIVRERAETPGGFQQIYPVVEGAR